MPLGKRKEENCSLISGLCSENSLTLLGEIPYDGEVPKELPSKYFMTYMAGSPAGKEITYIWGLIEKRLQT